MLAIRKDAGGIYRTAAVNTQVRMLFARCPRCSLSCTVCYRMRSHDHANLDRAQSTNQIILRIEQQMLIRASELRQ